MKPPEPDVGLLAGWCASANDVEEAKQATHDGLIRMMGLRRRSGVTWRLYDGAVAQAVATQMRNDATGVGEEALIEYYAQILRKLRTRGGVLVIASAEAWSLS